MIFELTLWMDGIFVVFFMVKLQENLNEKLTNAPRDILVIRMKQKMKHGTLNTQSFYFNWNYFYQNFLGSGTTLYFLCTINCALLIDLINIVHSNIFLIDGLSTISVCLLVYFFPFGHSRKRYQSIHRSHSILYRIAWLI